MNRRPAGPSSGDARSGMKRLDVAHLVAWFATATLLLAADAAQSVLVMTVANFALGISAGLALAKLLIGVKP